MTLIHLVSFKYKAGVDDAIRAQHRERLRALRDIDGVDDLKVGADVVKGERSYDTGLLVVFRDRAAHDAYQKDPRHVPVAQFGREHCQQIVTADFEA